MSPELRAKAEKLSMKGIGAAVRAYLDAHPEVKVMMQKNSSHPPTAHRPTG